MSASAISTTANQLVPGSLTLTRAEARERGYDFYDIKNQTTGETTTGYSTPLTGISCPLTNACQVQQLAGVPTQAGIPTQSTIDIPNPGKFGVYRPDLAEKYADGDTAAVESKLSEMLEQAGIDTQAPITLTQESKDGSRLLVGKDNPNWQAIQDFLDNTPALANDIRHAWNEQVMKAKVQAVEVVNAKIDAAAPPPSDTSWLDAGRAELARIDSLSSALVFRNGRFDFSKIAGNASG